MFEPKQKPPKLLAKDIIFHTAESYWAYVVSLYQPRTSAGKSREPKFGGKKLKAETKSRPGLFEISYEHALGTKTYQFQFRKDQLPGDITQILVKVLDCPRKKLEDFLIKKNFSNSANFSVDLTHGPDLLSLYPKRKILTESKGAEIDNRNTEQSCSEKTIK